MYFSINLDKNQIFFKQNQKLNKAYLLSRLTFRFRIYDDIKFEMNVVQKFSIFYT